MIDPRYFSSKEIAKMNLDADQMVAIRKILDALDGERLADKEASYVIRNNRGTAYYVTFARQPSFDHVGGETVVCPACKVAVPAAHYTKHFHDHAVMANGGETR